MSLTSMLDSRQAPLREWFERTLPNLEPVTSSWKAAGPPTLLPACEKPKWGLLGGAIDYRIRYMFGLTPPEDFIAAYGDFAHPDLQGEQLEARLSPEGDAYHRLSASLTAHVSAVSPVGGVCDTEAERRLARFCYLLAMYEAGARSGRPYDVLLDLGPAADTEAQLALVDDDHVDDLVQLAHGFVSVAGDLFGKPHILNPTFAGSGLVQGADADLIVDKTLVEVKTTKEVRPRRDWAYQLLGYYLLDLDDEYGIERVAFHVARIPTLLVWNAEELLGAAAGKTVEVAELRASLREHLERNAPRDVRPRRSDT